MASLYTMYDGNVGMVSLLCDRAYYCVIGYGLLSINDMGYAIRYVFKLNDCISLVTRLMLCH